MNKKFVFLILFIGNILFQSCQDDEPITIESFTGHWIEDTDNTGAFGGEDLAITFMADETFNMKIDGWTDAINQNDPCGFSWTFYVSGTFEIDVNKIIFTGEYTDETFATPQPNCAGQTQLYREYLFDFRKGDLYFNAGAANEFKLVLQ